MDACCAACALVMVIGGVPGRRSWGVPAAAAASSEWAYAFPGVSAAWDPSRPRSPDSLCPESFRQRGALLNVTARCRNGGFRHGVIPHLSESLALAWAVRLRLGGGILHSIEKATQLVHGTPRLAASHRTCAVGLLGPATRGSSYHVVARRERVVAPYLSCMACLCTKIPKG